VTDAVTAIERDHRELEALFDKVLGAGPADRDGLLDEVAARLAAHSRAEELEVYPYVGKPDTGERDAEVVHAEREHFEAEHLLRRARNLTASPHFAEAFTAFVAAVRQHVEEEERTVLPKLRRLVDADTLARLGAAFETERARFLGAPGQPTVITRDALYARAQAEDVPGRSRMTKQELADALGEPT
jgi:hemerythrin superfamily protein